MCKPSESASAKIQILLYLSDDKSSLSGSRPIATEIALISSLSKAL